MKYCIILLGVGLIVSIGLSADSLYIHQGIHGMKWGSLISDYDGLTKVHEKHQAAFYAKSNMLYHTANQKVSRVLMGFTATNYMQHLSSWLQPINFPIWRRNLPRFTEGQK